MKRLRRFWKRIKNGDDTKNLSEALEKLTVALDEKVVELTEESKKKELDDVIVKDEDDNFVDRCTVIRPGTPEAYFVIASDVLKTVVTVQESFTKKLKQAGMIFFTVLMVFYTIFNVLHISAFGNTFLMWLFLGMFITLFLVTTVVNIFIYTNTRSKHTPTDRQIKIVKNYRSVSIITRRMMYLWTLVLTIYSMIVTWKDGFAYQFLNIFMLVICSCVIVYFIYREARKVKRRAVAKKQNTVKAVFASLKQSVSQTRTATMLKNKQFYTGDEAEEEIPEVSNFRTVMQERKRTAKVKKEIQRGYKENYKNERKRLRQQYLDSVDKIK